MSKVKIQGHASGSGTLTIGAPNTDSDRTLTLPDATGTLLNSDGDGSNLTGISSVGGATGVDFNDNVKIRLGTGNDYELYHDGTHTYMDNNTGALFIRNNGSVVIEDLSGNNIIRGIDGGAVDLYHDGSAKLTTSAAGLTVTGDATVTSGDIVFGTAGKGVCLGVTSNTDANTLDDYEEGTWTPTNNGGSISLSVSSARYTKIGRLVHVHAYLGTSNDGDGTQMVIGGLPFAASTNTYEMGIGRFSGYGSTGNAYVSTVSGQSYLWVVDSNTFLNENDVDAGGGDWNINVTYHTG